MEVATGLIDGVKLLDLFGGARKKKVFLYLPSASQTTSSSNHTVTIAPTLSAASSTPTCSLVTIPTSLPASSIATTPTLTTPVSTPERSMTPANPAEILTTPPTGGAATRRYLTALAHAAGASFDDTDSSSELESVVHDMGLVASSGDEDDDATMQITGGLPSISPVADDLDSRIPEETPLYGYVTDDYTSAGVVTGDKKIVSRTSEIIQCLAKLSEDCRENALLPYLTHTFEEFLWQGTEDGKVMVVVLLSHPLEDGILENLTTILTSVIQTVDNCYLWISSSESPEAEKGKEWKPAQC